METNIASQDNSATPLLNFRASQMKAARSSDDGLQLDMEGNGSHFPVLQMFFKLKKQKNFINPSWEIWVGLPGYSYSSHKSNITHPYPCVQYFYVSKQWHDCQCLGLLTWAQMLLHVAAHEGCMNTVESLH